MTHHKVSPVPPEGRTYQGRPAGVVTRVVAAVIDGGVVVAILGSAYAVWVTALFVLSPRSFNAPSSSALRTVTACLAVLIVYLAACWAVTGRSLGAQVLGLRVVNHRGGRVRPATALVRAAFCAVFPIGLLWCAISRKNESIQDLVLHTRVRYDWRPMEVWLAETTASRTLRTARAARRSS